MYIYDVILWIFTTLQGGEYAWDALSCTSLSAKEPLITPLFCGK